MSVQGIDILPFPINFPSLETYGYFASKIDLQELWILPSYMIADISFSYKRWIIVVLLQVAVPFIGEWRLLLILLSSAVNNQVFAELCLSP